MRFTTYSYSPVTADLTRFLSNATGGTWTLSATTTADGLAHQVTIRNDSATDHSAKTAILVGTDADGKTATETLALPAGTATTTSVLYYKTLTSITPSATIGADTMDIGNAAPSMGPTLPMDYYNIVNAGVSLQVSITGTINYGIQHTLENVLDPTTSTLPQSKNWLNHSSLAAKTASSDGNYAFPIRALRFITTSVTNGATVSFTVMQGVV